MRTHIIVKHSDIEFTAQGIGNYFWWIIFYEYGEWVISSIWGKTYKTVDSFNEAVNWISEDN